MAKFKLNIEETRIMHHYITVETEDEDDIFDEFNSRESNGGKKLQRIIW